MWARMLGASFVLEWRSSLLKCDSWNLRHSMSLHLLERLAFLQSFATLSLHRQSFATLPLHRQNSASPWPAETQSPRRPSLPRPRTGYLAEGESAACTAYEC